MDELHLVSTDELLQELGRRPVVGVVLLADDRRRGPRAGAAGDGRYFVATPVNMPAAEVVLLLETTTGLLISDLERAGWEQPEE